jgi:hypothetical protein
MIKVVSYIQTMGSEKLKTFLVLPFITDMIYPICNKSTEILFSGWRGKDMGTWHKFTNDDKIVLEFYAETYNINVRTKTYTMPIPKTINDFINDMDRFGIQLYWSEWMDNNFEPKEYLYKDEIQKYFGDLLKKMGKSHELL